VVRPENPLQVKQQFGVLVAGGSRAAALTCPVDKVGADLQGVRNQRGALAPRGSWVPCLGGPVGKV
jgi:hypothetical protein